MKTAATDDPRADIVLRLYDLFRAKGYDGVSIGDISEATGLGRSSLYHHFPGGKEEMAETVIAFARDAIAREALAPLSAPGGIRQRLDAMIAGIDRLYEGGKGPCVLSSLLQSGEESPLADGLRAVFSDWTSAIARALKQAGVESKLARAKAVEALAQVQGGLVMARALGEPGAFRLSLKAARRTLEP